MTELLFVVFYEREQRIEAVVKDQAGQRRRVAIRWHSKDRTPVPKNWFAMVEAELRLQDDEAKARASGRILF